MALRFGPGHDGRAVPDEVMEIADRVRQLGMTAGQPVAPTAPGIKA